MLFGRRKQHSIDVAEAMAATAARRAGMDARNVAGGMTAWERHGLEMERTSR
jgi:rhodanese-related sulfurtransferase